MADPRTAIIVAALKDLATDQLEDALALPGKASIGSDIGPEIRSYTKGRTIQAVRGKFQTAFQAGVGLRIDLLNSPSDQSEDATGVFGKATDDEDYGINPAPRLHPGAATGWLKYAFFADLRVETAASLGVASFSAEASRTIEYAAYRPQPMGARIADALLADLRNMPTALEADDVATLAPGEAVSVRVPGQISFGLDLDESIFASSSLQSLASGFGLVGPVSLEFSRGFSFSVDLSFQDDTRLVFVGLSDGWVHTSLRKAQSSELGMEAGLELKIGFTKKSQESLLERVGEALFGAPEEALDDLSQQLNFAQLNPEQVRLLTTLGVKIGETSSGDALLAAVKEKLTDRKTKLLKALEQILTARVEIGFKFEYGRVSTDGSLFEAELSPTAVRELHADLLNFKLHSAIALARAQDSTRLRNFFLLHGRSVERSATFGFTLGVGKWLTISGRSTGKRLVVEQTNHAKQKRLYWTSSREVASAFNQGAASTRINFRADTEEFRAHPTMADLKLSIGMDWEQSELKPDYLPQLLDLAALWRVYSPNLLASELVKARAFIADQERFAAALELRISDRLVRAMAAWVATHDNADFGPLLARALPYWKGHDAREVEALREAVYAPIFHDYLAAEKWPLPNQRIRTALWERYRKLATAEYHNRDQSVSFVGYATKQDAIGNQPIGMRLNALRRACKQLIELPSRTARELDQILNLFYDQQRVFADRSFMVRLFGALLAQIAIDSGYDDGWNASLTLSYKPEKGDRKLLVTGKGGTR